MLAIFLFLEINLNETHAIVYLIYNHVNDYYFFTPNYTYMFYNYPICMIKINLDKVRIESAYTKEALQKLKL